jgi:glycosyltransferase involved in cell wall biosynthesis
MIILIPCYRPDAKLLALVADLAEHRTVLVDDGSGPAYAEVFDAARTAGCDVLGYSDNCGKGFALKHGLAYIDDVYPGEDVVCADCDGQHTPADIRKVAGVRDEHPDSILLGSRLFAGAVPLRNRYGNLLTSAVFARVTGRRLRDTQTGLRGYPASLLPWLLDIPGEGYEYELEILLAASGEGVPVVEVPIATVYLDGNRSSHIRLPRDLIRIYRPMLRWAASGPDARGRAPAFVRGRTTVEAGH